MGLANFIRNNSGPIIEEWETFAQTLVPAADGKSPLTLRNHIKDILDFIITDIDAPQTASEQVKKSRGGDAPNTRPSAAEIHASLRFDGGFNMDQMVSEFRSLRASIIKLWYAAADDVKALDVQELTRFNEAIDQVMAEAICDYTKKVNEARNLFLGILSHDLRNPLGAISMSAELTMRMDDLNPRQVMLQTQIVESAKRAREIVDNLLDLTRARLGSGLPILRGQMDMGFVANRLVEEMRAKHPERIFYIRTQGTLAGAWDKARIGQVFSNLIGNAIEHGFTGTPVSVVVDGLPREVMVTVHNQGIPISAKALRSIFQTLSRPHDGDEQPVNAPTVRLGLGLFICREIIEAHGGTIEVVSTEDGGTTFTARFPRFSDKKVIELLPLRDAAKRRADPKGA